MILGLWLPCPGKTDRMTGWWTGVHGVACTSIAFRHCLVQAFVHCVRIDASRRQAGKSMRNQTSFFSLNRMETPNGHVLRLRYNSCIAAKPTSCNVPIGRPSIQDLQSKALIEQRCDAETRRAVCTPYGLYAGAKDAEVTIST